MRLFALVAVFFLSACSTFVGPGYQGNIGTTKPIVINRSDYKPLPSDSLLLAWPVGKVSITSKFKTKKRPGHKGLDLDGVMNDPIYAAESGTVIFSGWQRGFGRVVKIKHRQTQATTLYAHLNKILVKRGQKVKKRQTIGKMGRTGRATGTHLHFEVIHDGNHINPEFYLPL